MGPEGPQGERGPRGQQGQQGQQGQPGNANVISSGWFLPTTQEDIVRDGSDLREFVIDAPELTSEVIDSAAVQVFMRFQSWTVPLPYTSEAGTGIDPSTVSFTLFPGKLHINRFRHNREALIGFGDVYFRYVIIPAEE